MITSLLRSRCFTACFTTLLGVATFAMLPSAGAAVIGAAPESVVTGDTYSLEMVGYNTSDPGANIYLINQFLMPVFGTTQTYSNSALGGQTLTIQSSEGITNGVQTDTFIVSVPSNFVPTGTKDNAGNIINAINFAVGNYYIPTGGTANTVDFNSPLVAPSVTGAVTINSPVMTGIGLTQNPIYTNGNKSFSDAESVSTASPTIAISANDPTSFSITLTSGNAVPEPSTYATALLGAAGLCWLTIVRRRTRA